VQRVVELLRHQPAVIRGNASEILAVAGSAVAGGRGTDSTFDAEAALEAGKELAWQQGCIVVISGATDLVRDDLQCPRSTDSGDSRVNMPLIVWGPVSHAAVWLLCR
jgi:hydroxyethylthiazole kinase-like sugar kinase family protein